jgi:glutathione peroxidase
MVGVFLIGCSVNKQPKTIFETSFAQESIEGKLINAFKGRVLLVVNISSKCGTTPQLSELEELYQKFKDREFLVLGFPSEDFGPMDTKTEAEIRSFCRTHYNVTFPLFGVTKVTGPHQNSFFRYLTSQRDTGLEGEITFNFEKFLINKEGRLIARFGSFTGPMSHRLIQSIEWALDEK